MRKATAAISAILAGSALALTATPAQAATQFYNSPVSCYTVHQFVTFCLGASVQVNSVQNNGVWVYNTIETTTYTATSADGDYFSRSYASKATFVSSRGSEITRHKSTETVTIDGQTCTIEENQVYANGSLRTVDSTVTCV